MRVPPTAGPRVVSWTAMTARRPAAASWTRISSSWPISRASSRAFMGAPEYTLPSLSLEARVKGSLSQGVLPVVLGRLYVERRSGLLHLTRGAERRSARFRKGHIVYAETTAAEDHMGEVLVRNGLLSPADLDR